LQAELGDDAIDGPLADGEVTLTKFLRDDLGAGIGVEEAVADDLADHFLGASVGRFGAAFGTEESPPALGEKKRAELEVTRAAVTEFGGGTVNTLATALALDQHGELAGDFIVFGMGREPEAPWMRWVKNSRESMSTSGKSASMSLFNYGTLEGSKSREDGDLLEQLGDVCRRGEVKLAGAVCHI